VDSSVVSYPRLATVIAQNLTDPILCTRLVRQTVQQLQLLTNESDIVEFHREPPSTGSPQWDALIAGVAAHTWSLGGHPTSLYWTRELHPLPQWWEPGDGPARWRDWNLVHTPPSLRERRVIFPQNWLQAI